MQISDAQENPTVHQIHPQFSLGHSYVIREVINPQLQICIMNILHINLLQPILTVSLRKPPQFAPSSVQRTRAKLIIINLF